MRAAILLFAACTTADVPLADDEAEHVATAIASTLARELAAMRDASRLVRGEQPAPTDVVFRVTCRDDQNHAIACGARTANADAEVTWAALLATSSLVTVASREGSWILNDITAERLRLDGDSHFEYASDTRHALAYDASYRNIVVVRDERWPRGGLVRYEIELTHPPKNAHAVTAEARFHAGGRATIVLPDHEYELDLTTGSFLHAQ